MLRDLGHDCLDASAIPARMPDVDVLRMAANDGRVVVTSDKDFGELVFVHAIGCPGVVLIRVALASEVDRGGARAVGLAGGDVATPWIVHHDHADQRPRTSFTVEPGDGARNASLFSVHA